MKPIQEVLHRPQPLRAHQSPHIQKSLQEQKSLQVQTKFAREFGKSTGFSQNPLRTLPIVSLYDARNDRRSQDASLVWHEVGTQHPLFVVLNEFFTRAFRTVPSFRQWPKSYNQIEYEHVQPSHGDRLFEGAIACSLMKDDLEHLYSGTWTYVWSFKTDGVRFHCCFLKTTVPGYEKVLAFRDRYGHTYVLSCLFCPDMMFDGTLWDGEIVWVPERNRIEYHIFGNIFTCGISCAMMDKISRVQIVQHTLEKWKMSLPCSYTPVDLTKERWVLLPSQIGAAIGFHVKPWYFLAQAALYRPLRLRLDYPTDPANILDPVEYPEIYGRHLRLYKRKDNVSNTVDTHAREADRSVPPKQEMVRSGLIKYSTDTSTNANAEVTKTEWKDDIPLLALYTYSLEQKCERLFTYATYPTAWPYDQEHCIVECQYDYGTSRWMIKCMRPDKKFPNDDVTIQKTMRNIDENLAWEDVCPFLQSRETKQRSLFYHDQSCIVYGALECKIHQARQDKKLDDELDDVKEKDIDMRISATQVHNACDTTMRDVCITKTQDVHVPVLETCINSAIE
jgi:hypothetical protein